MRQKKYLLQEQDIPTQWYNIQADMPNKPLPPLNPQTHKPLNADDLSHIFNKECSKQELDVEHAWIDIPEDVREKYTYYRSTPLVRAYALEEALGTPAHIYFKNESTNPLGSHKINSAIPQCYYCPARDCHDATTTQAHVQDGAAIQPSGPARQPRRHPESHQYQDLDGRDSKICPRGSERRREQST